MFRSTFSIALLALSATAAAEDFSYNYVSFGYGNTDFDTGRGGQIDNFNADGDGFVLSGAVEITDQIHAFASYDSADLGSNVDISRWSAGIGYNTSISDVTDMYARISYESFEIDLPLFGSIDDSGYGFAVGMRYAATDAVELNAAINYVDYGDFGDDTALEIGGLYELSDVFSLGLSAEFGDDFSAWALSGRYYFGR